MGRQAIFLPDEKAQDLEGHLDYSKNDDAGSVSKASSSPIKVFVKWALICTLVVLAMTFTLELLEPQSSKARRSLRETTYVHGSLTDGVESCIPS